MKHSKKTILAALFALTLPASAASTVYLINFSSGTGNDITNLTTNAISNAGDIGVTDLANVVNVRTGTTSATASATINLAGISGTVKYGDYYQANQLGDLGQPYATVLGPQAISTATSFYGGRLTVALDLNLSDWMAANHFTSYEVTVYYAGRHQESSGLMDGNDSLTRFVYNGDQVSPDEIQVGYTSDAGRWSGHGQTHVFDAGQLHFEMDYYGPFAAGNPITSMNNIGGVAAVKLVGIIPEPSAALLGAFGLLALARRRR